MKKIFVGVLCFILMMSFFGNVKAVENKDLGINPYETEIPVIEIDGNMEALYKQFVDHKLALYTLVKEHTEFFEQLADEYGVGKISLSNWRPYRDIAFMLYYTDPTNELYDKMASFFDIFENTFKNDLAKIKIANHDYEGLEYLLPYSSRYVRKVLGER